MGHSAPITYNSVKEKNAEIIRLHKMQINLAKKGLDIASLPPPKRNSTALKRAFKTLAIALHVRQLENEKQIIRSQPIANETSR